MNYLAHLHLGGHAADELRGSLYGDFVKGALDGRFSAAVERAIRLHRAIDLFTDTHPLLVASRARFAAKQRRVAGIVLDLFFDHCLARDWAQYEAQPLARFTARVYRVLLDSHELPPGLAAIAPRMAAQDWLGSYRDFAVLEVALGHMARRLSRPRLFDGAFAELTRLYPLLSHDFAEFYPQLMQFAKDWRAMSLSPAPPAPLPQAGEGSGQ